MALWACVHLHNEKKMLLIRQKPVRESGTFRPVFAWNVGVSQRTETKREHDSSGKDKDIQIETESHM